MPVYFFKYSNVLRAECYKTTGTSFYMGYLHWKIRYLYSMYNYQLQRIFLLATKGDLHEEVRYQFELVLYVLPHNLELGKSSLISLVLFQLLVAKNYSVHVNKFLVQISHNYNRFTNFLRYKSYRICSCKPPEWLSWKVCKVVGGGLQEGGSSTVYYFIF